MNKNFIKATLFAAFMFVATGAFVSCQDYDDDISGLQEQIDGIKTGSIAPIEQQLTALKEADKALQGNDEVMKASIAALESTKNDYIAADKALGDALKVLINGKVDQAAYDKAVKDLNAAVKGLEGKNADLAKKFEDLAGQLAVFKTEVGSANEATKKAMKEAQELMIKTAAEINGKIAALEASKTTMAQVQAEIGKSTTEVKALITALENGSIKDLKTATAKNLKLIQDNQAQLATIAGAIKGLENQDVILKNAFEAGDKVLAEADKAIYKAIEAQGLRITELDTRFTNLLGGYVKTSVFDAYKTANGEALSGLTGRIDGLAGTLEGLKAQMKTDSLTLQNQINTLKKFNTDSKFQAQIDGLKGQLSEVTGLAQKASDLAGKNAGEIEKLITATGEGGRIDNAIAAAIGKLEATYKSDKDALAAKLRGIFGRLDVLEGRIQSIVYIPEYTDGIVPQYFAINSRGAVVGQGTLKMKFRVAPAAMAKNIKPENLAFICQKLQTRAITSGMGVTAAEGDEAGVLTVTVETGDEFTPISKNAVALTLKTTMKLSGEEAEKDVDDVTTEYIRVEGMALDNENDFKISTASVLNAKYTDEAKFYLFEDIKVLRDNADGRDITKCGFEQGWVISKINNIYNDNKGTHQAEIKAYKDGNNCGFNLIGNSVQIKEKFRNAASIGKTIVLTLMNPSTGFSADITYQITASDAQTGDYGVIEKAKLEETSSCDVFAWTNTLASAGVNYTLNSVEVLNQAIPSMTAAQVLDVLDDKTATSYVMNNKGVYVAATAKDAKLVVEEGSGATAKMHIVVPTDAVWKTYKMKTVFSNTGYNEVTVTATLNLTCPTQTLYAHNGARWFSDTNYLITPDVAPVSGNLFSFVHNLNAGYKVQDGVTFKYELLKTVGVDPNKKVPDGVTIDPTSGVITFTKGVDPKLIKIKSSLVVNGNILASEEYDVTVKYPVKETFESFDKIASYKKADILANTPYDWANTQKDNEGTAQPLMLLDKAVTPNQLLSGGLLVANTWTTTYGLKGLKFTLGKNYLQADKNQEGVAPSQIKVELDNGKLSFTKGTNIARPIFVEIKVEATNTYGKSTSTFVIPVDATEVQ